MTAVWTARRLRLAAAAEKAERFDLTFPNTEKIHSISLGKRDAQATASAGARTGLRSRFIARHVTCMRRRRRRAGRVDRHCRSHEDDEDGTAIERIYTNACPERELCASV